MPRMDTRKKKRSELGETGGPVGDERNEASDEVTHAAHPEKSNGERHRCSAPKSVCEEDGVRNGRGWTTGTPSTRVGTGTGTGTGTRTGTGTGQKRASASQVLPSKVSTLITLERRGGLLCNTYDLVTKLKINEDVALKNLNKWDDDLMQKLRENPSWNRKIQSWKENDLNPIDVATILNGYPSLSRRHSTEWNAWKIYAAQYLRLSQSL
ncbi:Hypothetical protein PHPALM_37873 [Phytophthora palmivora]|uniref:Uncharacterized protein n=1 Tax=Phytophthora palmivora TaxID=4796 RepID=A0A2P4WWB2_9STRA|nr:Hypothetical protein PHPALM_37873 [Phytophthora palmivora]